MNRTVSFGLLAGSLILLGGCGEFSQSRPAPAVAEAPPAVVAPGTDTPAEAPLPQRQRLLKVASAQLGTPYRYGGTSPSRGFDCSGFTSWVYRQVGVSLPRTAAAQYRQSQRIKRAELKVGDLLFFRIDGRSISHVAIYTGKNRFIHAPSSGKKVSFDTLDNPYWIKHWVGSGRFI